VDRQFDVAIVYAYVGEMSPNISSFSGERGINMSVISHYASSVMLNGTRLHGTAYDSCDAFIEVYNLQISTDTNLTENYHYFVGTNYKVPFTTYWLPCLSSNISKVFPNNQPIVTMGDFRINTTDGPSFLSTPLGSYGAYSSMPTSSGLWRNGKPNEITVTAQRVGVLTIRNGVVAIQKDNLNTAPKVTVNLGSYGSGFLYNTLVPSSALETIDLFHPVKNSPNS
jgi:hypothetical protein